MDHDKDEQTRVRAYHIWEDEGRPEGRDAEHWLRAEQAGTSAQPAQGSSHPGMFGDGTEEQNLNQAGTPGARITESEVKEAFSETKAPAKK